MKNIRYYSSVDVAKLFGVTRQTVNNWIADERFPNVGRIGRKYILPEDDVRRVAREHTAELEAQIERIHAAF